MQIKHKERHYSISTRMATNKDPQYNVGEDVEEMEFSSFVVGM